MFRMIIIGVVLSGTGLFLVLGPASAWTSLRGSREVARERIEQGKPDVQRAAEIRVLLRDMDEQLFRYTDQLAEVEEQASGTKQEIAELERQLERERTRLAQARDLLAGDESRFRIGGRWYDRQEVRDDAKLRMRRAKRLAADLGTRRQVAEQLGAAVEEGKGNLAEARRVQRSKIDELTQLEARLENAKLLEKVNELAHQVQGDVLGPRTQLGRKFGDLERRVRQTERRARRGQDLELSPAPIDWESEEETASDIIADIDRFLGREDEAGDSGEPEAGTVRQEG